MANVTILVGIPASGKSTWAKENAYGRTVLSSDAIREELYGSEEEQGTPTEVFDELYTRMDIALSKGEDVIIDATSIGRRERYTAFKIAKRHNASVDGIIFDTPFTVCVRRNDARDRTVPDFVMDRMIKSYEEPSIKEGFDRITVVRYSE